MKTGDVPFLAAEWMSLRQVTHYAAVSERTIRTWIHAPVDSLPAVRVRGKILIRRRDFDAWLENRRLKSLVFLNIDGMVKDILEGLPHGR